MSTTTGNPPAPQVWPTFRAKDADALIRFLVDVVGFEETMAHRDDDGVVQHAELAWPEGGGVMLGQERESGACVTRPGSFSAYVVTADPDALHDRVAAAGAEVTTPPFDTDYGSRDFALRDPEGNAWNFGTYPGHPRGGS
ncbi:Glyoxalase family protein [Actinokineospora spheciospongiae]|uniref:Glyoxalase family protein n=1 Tax=Actinokineospora spheciospongiae TaxID=909613 RepID=W7J175_9PSEU|nr:VOC family protein [Actinokineospora spheciospongiae]EWC59864.1 Glyoxalase family protein [Actinokineospora spheciospongiae]PWW63104.1 putative glyoxalase superfamily protein PhnB [Actinokineospora spheciospongiae]